MTSVLLIFNYVELASRTTRQEVVLTVCDKKAHFVPNYSLTANNLNWKDLHQGKLLQLLPVW